MEKTKKVRMPAGIRNKLLAAIAMLLVSSIMMVSSTYAWFTLSTAPEVTGITTSVGANGNLEIALLTTDTYKDMTTITSNVGSSSATTNDVTVSNITWGNLVDLSAAGYGLTGISLMPAAPNGTGTINVTNPLLTAVYGADGRVATTDGQTVSAVADAGGAFVYGETQTYGVRAIGTTSNLSVREIALRDAKNVVNSTINSAKRATKSAIYNHMAVLLQYALTAKGEGEESAAPTSYEQDDLTAFLSIANGVAADLATLENGYRNAAIAYAAANAADDDTFALAKTAITAAPLSDLASQQGMGGLGDAITALVTAKGNVDAAKATLTAAAAVEGGINAESTAPTLDEVNAAIKLLVAGIGGETDATPATVYIAGGAVGELGAQVGTFEVATVGNLGTVYAGAAAPTAVKFDAVVEVVADLTVNNTATTASNITDTYGYIIDFAFRTNASGSNLQLQTSAVNRVYTDQTSADLATQGSGSTVTYTFASGMTETQVNKLLSAIRLVFLNTTTGEVYKTARLTNINVGDTQATANVKLDDQTGDTGIIVALEQNVAKAISVLVYMDGNLVDNSAVINGANSGSLNLNLQFSSDADLIPMKNSALQNMVK